MTFQLRKATRTKAKVRIGLSGPSGSGKTYSALLIASGMAAWEKIALIDTENGSGDLYSHLGPYNVITLTAPYSPERYIEAIEACEKAGMEIIVIDSVTPEWDGKGGLLESNELLGQTRFKGNNWAAWSVTTPRHQKFVDTITRSKAHIITTARAKIDTIQTEDKKIKKVGLKEIQREGWEYELTVNFTLDRDGNYATASKDRTELFGNGDPFRITQDTGKKLLAWANAGEVEEVPVAGPTPVPAKAAVVPDAAPPVAAPTFPPTPKELATHAKAVENVGQPAQPQPAPAEGGPKILPVQTRKIMALWKEYMTVTGHPAAESTQRRREAIQKMFNKDSSTKLTEAEASKFIKAIEAKTEDLLEKKRLELQAKAEAERALTPPPPDDYAAAEDAGRNEGM